MGEKIHFTNISFMVTFLIEQKGITFDHFTFLLLHSPFLLPSFSRWEEGKRITKVVVKGHAFLFFFNVEVHYGIVWITSSKTCFWKKKSFLERERERLRRREREGERRERGLQTNQGMKYQIQLFIFSNIKNSKNYNPFKKNGITPKMVVSHILHI